MSVAKMTPGRQLAERLGLTIVGTEGHDLKVACPFCRSSDAGRIHQDTGAYFCFSCQKGANGFDLCKQLGQEHKAAVAMMREVGLFQDYMSAGGNGHAAPTGGNGKTPAAGSGKANQGGDIIGALAEMKGVTRAAFVVYGAQAKANTVCRFPMYGGDGKVCSTFWMSLKETKGRNEGGKPSGLFLPGRKPKPGETWILCEGVKSASAYHDLGYLAAGTPGMALRLKDEWLPMFQDVDLVQMPDSDWKSIGNAVENAKRLLGRSPQ